MSFDVNVFVFFIFRSESICLFSEANERRSTGRSVEIDVDRKLGRLPGASDLIAVLLKALNCSYRSRYTSSNWQKAANGAYNLGARSPQIVGINPLFDRVQS